MAAVRLALSQFGAGLGDVDGNLARMLDAMEAAADARAELVCFPELSLSGYMLGPDDYGDALLDAVEGATRKIADRTRQLGIAALYGAPRRGPNQRPRNAVVLAQPGGRQLVYDKTHMVTKELKVFAAGDAFAVTEDGIGLACCYDLAFPEAIRILALRGAQVVIVPMAWEIERSFVMRGLLAARAIENVAFVVAVNQSGRVGPLRFSGGSTVVDPLGETIFTSGAEATLGVVEIDRDFVSALRNQRDTATYPLLADRRPDLYGQIGAGKRAQARNGVLSQTSVCSTSPSAGIDGIGMPQLRADPEPSDLERATARPSFARPGQSPITTMRVHPEEVRDVS